MISSAAEAVSCSGADCQAAFLPVSYGFRPMRRAHDAIAEIQRFGTKGYQWVLDADIEACFASSVIARQVPGSPDHVWRTVVTATMMASSPMTAAVTGGAALPPTASAVPPTAAPSAVAM